MSLVSIVNSLIDNLIPEVGSSASNAQDVTAAADAKLQDDVTKGLAGEAEGENSNADSFVSSSDSAKSQAAEVETNLETNEAQTEEVKASIIETDANIETKTSEISTTDSEISTTDSEISSTDSEISGAEAKITSAESELTNAQALLAVAQASAAQNAKADEGAEAPAASNGPSVEEAQNAVKAAEQSISQAQQEKETLETKKEELETKKEELEAQKEGLEADKEGLEAQKETLTAEEASLEDEHTSLEAESENVQAEAEGIASGAESVIGEANATVEKTNEYVASQEAKAQEEAQQPEVAAEQPAAEQAVIEQPAAQQPAVEQPAAEQPAAQQIAAAEVKADEQKTEVKTDEQQVEEPQFQYQDNYYQPDVETRIYEGYATDAEMAEFIVYDMYSGQVTADVNELIGMSADQAVASLAEAAKTEAFSNSVYKTKISQATDSATVEENQKAISEFVEAYNEAADTINTPNVEFLSLTDKSNYEAAEALLKRIDMGEYIITKNIEEATMSVQSIQVSAVDSQDETEKKFNTQGNDVLSKLQGVVTDNEEVEDNLEDDVLTKNEYKDMENFFKSADDKEVAYDKLVKDAKKYGIFASQIAA